MAAVAVQTQQGFGHHPQHQPQAHNGLLAHQAQQEPATSSTTNPTTAVWSNPNPPLPRGRAPRDPLAVTARYDCQTLADMESKLRDYLHNPPAAPEHCTCELTLWAGASFLVKLDYIPPNLRPNPQQNDVGMLQAVADFNTGRGQAFDGRETTLSVLDALQQLNDPKETMKRQRAISKVCVAAVQKTDGYRYSFHNSWKSGEDNAYRFSYYCNDSLLNKDRVANGKSGSQGKRATKPVYDCKGVLSIKFSATKQSVEIVYRHIPCHETYEDRAPPPRKNSKRRAEWEEKNPDRVKTLKESAEPESADQSQNVAQKQAGDANKEPKKKKKKKEGEPHKSAEAELREQSMFSLLELMRPEEPKKVEEKAPAPVVTVSPPVVPPPVVNTVATNPGPQKTPARRPKNAASCAICHQRRTKCDGRKPRCTTCSDKGFYCFYQPEPSTSVAPGTAGGVPIPLTTASGSASASSLPSFENVQNPRMITDVALVGQNEDLQKEIASMRQEQATTQKEHFDLKAKLAEMQKQIEGLKSENARLNAPQQATMSQASLNHGLTQPALGASALSQSNMNGSPMNQSSMTASNMSQSMAQASLNQSAINQPMAQSSISNPLNVGQHEHQRRTPSQAHHTHPASHQPAYAPSPYGQSNTHAHQPHLYGHHGPSPNQTAHTLGQTSAHSLGQNPNTLGQAPHALNQNAHARQQPQPVYGNPERANTWAQPMYGPYANQYGNFR